jgi:hypothetical protein
MSEAVVRAWLAADTGSSAILLSMPRSVKPSEWPREHDSWEPLPLQLPVAPPSAPRRDEDVAERDDRDRAGSYVVVIDLA